MIYVLPSQPSEPHRAKPTFYLSPSLSSRKSKVHVCWPQWSWSSWPCIEKAPFSKTLAASYLLAECDDARRQPQFKKTKTCSNMTSRMSDVIHCDRRDHVIAYLVTWETDTLDTANSDCGGWSSFICSSLAVRTRRWWQLLSAAIYGTDRWMTRFYDHPSTCVVEETHYNSYQLMTSCIIVKVKLYTSPLSGLLVPI